MRQPTKTRTIRLLAALLVGGLAFGVASPALAQTDTVRETDTADTIDIVDLKTRCINAIDQRFGSLADAHLRLDESEFITAEHHRSLDSIIADTESGLRELRSEIDASTDRDEIRRLCGLIGPDFRVYLVVIPQIGLTASVDRIEAAQEKVDEFEERFFEAVDDAIEAGADVTEAVRLAEEAIAQAEAAIEGVHGVADSVLAVTPASYNEGPGATTLEGAKESVRNSHGQLKSARKTAKSAIRALKQAIAEV